MIGMIGEFKSYPESIPDSIRIYGALLDIGYKIGDETLISGILEQKIRVSSALPYYKNKIFLPVSMEELVNEKEKTIRKKLKGKYKNGNIIIKKKVIEIPRVNIKRKKLFYSKKEYFAEDSNEDNIIQRFIILIKTSENYLPNIKNAFNILSLGSGLSKRRNLGYGEFKIVGFKKGISLSQRDILLSKFIPTKEDIQKINIDKSIIKIGSLSGKSNNGLSFGPYTMILESSKISSNENLSGKIIHLKKNRKYIIGTPFILGDNHEN